LREVIRRHEPEAAAVEEVFYAANVKTALKLAHARGATLLVVAESGIECAEYSPLAIKTSVVGRAARFRGRQRRPGSGDLPRHLEPEPAGGHIQGGATMKYLLGIVLLTAAATAAEGPRIVYSKNRPGGYPSYVEITVERPAMTASRR